MNMDQKELEERLEKEHNQVRIDLEEELEMLRGRQKELELSIPKRRSQAEEDAWLKIDALEDKNKAALLGQIELGVKHASELTKQKAEL